MPAGAILRINDMLVFDSLNGFYAYGWRGWTGQPYWQIANINDFNTGVGPVAHWTDGTLIPGFTTKVRARALLTDTRIYDTAGTLPSVNSGFAFFAIRVRKVLAASEFQGNPSDYNPLWVEGYSDDEVNVVDSDRVFFGPIIGSAVSAVWMGPEYGPDGSHWAASPSGLETEFAATSGDGNYMVEVYEWHVPYYNRMGWVPDKIFVQFAKVKD